MALPRGTRLGPYEILDPIGRGGMGEVFNARDARLDRAVAIKVLPEPLAGNPERRARFEREAKAISQLNHPNICTLHDVGFQDGADYLVMELVEGETLSERLTRGPLPWEEAQPLFVQIADALEAAHEKGIVHRDLKPANIKVTPEGRVKVLDFGLAKAYGVEPVATDSSQSPTAAYGTLQGVILGTAAYMSPEQARGKTVDKRTDVWAFGCVLYEALAGKKAFGGETMSDTTAAVLRSEPDWNALPPTVPRKLVELLSKCLRKDARRRLHDIADARIEVEDAGSATLDLTQKAPSRRVVAGASLASLVLGIVLGFLLWSVLRDASAPRSPIHLAVTLPSDEVVDTESSQLAVAFSPQGDRLAYVARREKDGGTRIYLRGLDQSEPVPVAGTEGAHGLFFSPDGEWLGFSSRDNKLKKVELAGGTPVTVTDMSYTERAWGMSWVDPDSMVIVSQPAVGLTLVSASGGTPEVLTRPDPSRDEMSHRWPEPLPDGGGILFTVKPRRDIPSWDDARIAVLSTSTGELRTVLEGGTHARYLPTGHLAFARAGALHVAPFDRDRLEVTGPPVRVLDGVQVNAATGVAQFSVSETGALAYVPGSAEAFHRELLWLDREGGRQEITPQRRYFLHGSLSPDGQRVALTVGGPSDHVWIQDVARGTMTRLTFEGNNDFALWTRDGEWVVFSSDRGGAFNLYWQPADGSAPAERLTETGDVQQASDWSPDGRTLAFVESQAATGWDILLLPMEGDRKPKPFLRTQFYEAEPAFSPDGRFLAYVSNESGRKEVYVRSYPGGGGKRQISTRGGTEPAWPREGREILYWEDHRMMSVPVSTAPELRAGTPRPLFEGSYNQGDRIGIRSYDVTADGMRFVTILRREEERAPRQIHVVLNWFDELRERLRRREE